MKGFETFLANIQSQLKDPLDLIVSSIHWILVQEFGFKCIGVGEKINTTEQDTSSNGSELLPSGWNSTPGLFTLLYRAPNRKEFILKCIAAETLLIATLSPLDAQSSQDICSASILKSEFLDNSHDLKTLIENFKNNKINHLNLLLKEKFAKMDPRQKSPVKKTEEYPMPPPFSKITDTQARPRSLLEEDPLYPRIGGADLDPLGRGIGGGMIFDPFSSGILRPQRGPRPRFPGNDVVPPGARYDPIGPLPDARFFKPDPDHFQPPRGPGFDPGFL